MSFLLFAVEHVLFVVALMAFAVAFLARLTPARRRWLWGWPVLLIPALYGFVAGRLATLDFTWRYLPSPWPQCLIGIATVICVLCLAVLFFGLRRAGDLGLPRAATWPIGTLGLVAMATLLLHGITFWNLDTAARGRIAVKRSEAAMLAISLAPSHTPDGENAAPLYREVFRTGILKEQPKDIQEQLYGAETNDGKIDFASPEFKAYLARCEPALKRVREATTRPACDFHRDWGRLDYMMLLPETQKMRDVAKLLSLSAKAKLASGDRTGAIDELLALHRLAGHTAQEPILVSMLVAVAIEHIACEQLAVVLDDPQLTDEELGLLSDWQPHPCYDWLHRALRVEEAAAVGSGCSIAEADFNGWFDDVLHQPAPWRVFAPFYRVFLWSRDIEGYQSRMRSTTNLVASIGMADSLPERAAKLVADNLDPRISPLQMLFLPQSDAVVNSAARIEANQRLLALAIAMKRHQRKTGALPTSLDEIASQVLVGPDPFDGKPFRMATTDSKVTLYSIGPNGKDDGGTPLTQDGHGVQIGDVVVTLRKE